MEDERIEIIGQGNLNPGELQTVQREVDFHAPKVTRAINEVSKIDIMVKPYHSEGKSKEYSIYVAVNIGSRKFEADNKDWRLSPGVREAFDKIMQELEHKFHLSDQH